MTEEASFSQSETLSNGRRISILEREDFLEGLKPSVIAAIHREIIETQLEWQAKMSALVRENDNRLLEFSKFYANERLRVLTLLVHPSSL